MNMRFLAVILAALMGAAGGSVFAETEPKVLVSEESEAEKLGGELVINGKDWTDKDKNGLADSWGDGSDPVGGQTNSIVTGLGFSGNAQRAEATAENNYFGFIQGSINRGGMIKGKKYQLRLKYRASQTVKISHNSPNSYKIGHLGSHTGEAKEATIEFTHGSHTTNVDTWLYLRFMVLPPSSIGDWLEIDDVSIKELKADEETAGAR